MPRFQLTLEETNRFREKFAIDLANFGVNRKRFFGPTYLA